jgi:hypothetical protein
MLGINESVVFLGELSILQCHVIFCVKE